MQQQQAKWPAWCWILREIMKCKHCMCPGILLRKFCNLFKNCALPDKQDIKLHGTCIRSGAEKVSLGCFWRIQDRGPLSIEVAAAASCKLQSSCWLSTGGHVSRLNKKHLESRYLILGQFGAFVYCLRGWYAISYPTSGSPLTVPTLCWPCEQWVRAHFHNFFNGHISAEMSLNRSEVRG